MKKIATLFLLGALVFPAVGGAQVVGEIDKGGVMDWDCDAMSSDMEFLGNWKICQSLMQQILQLQVQLLTLQLQVLLKAQAASAPASDVPAYLPSRAVSGTTPTEEVESGYRASVYGDGLVCRGNKVVLPVSGGGDWQEVFIKVHSIIPAEATTTVPMEWNTRLVNEKPYGKEVFETVYDLGRWEDLKGRTLAWEATVYKDGPNRFVGHYEVASDSGEEVVPVCGN